jgi:antitoxin ParD1/3/4
MNVSLTPELEAMIRQQVDSGRYNNASEVVREALRLLDEHQRVQHLRSLLAVGLEQAQRGELVEFTPELVEDIARMVPPRRGTRSRCLPVDARFTLLMSVFFGRIQAARCSSAKGKAAKICARGRLTPSSLAETLIVSPLKTSR